MFAKTAGKTTHFLRLYRRFREQVRSHGLRPESKADLRITLSAPGGNACRDAPRHNSAPRRLLYS
ncbi:hypothetical protein CXB38_12750 [Pseudomonas syringae]|nr:hypothetical protein CXB35_03075 [Pseudomonas syringae]POP81581.1 hypothetical protein CXB38_12750 [Pseudomonas syringae]